MLTLIATQRIIEKIWDEHQVSMMEAEEAYFNWRGVSVIETREMHLTVPKTEWFISKTFEERLLKVVMIPYYRDGFAILRTAYEPSENERMIYAEKQRKNDENSR